MPLFTGEIAALSAACLWAISTVVFGQLGKRIPPLFLNGFKGLIAIALIVITLLLTQAEIPNIATKPIILLLLSGSIGLGLGDTAYFLALNRLGARRTLLIETLAPPLTALGGLVFLRENLSPMAWVGILLTVLGVAWVIAERTPLERLTSVDPIIQLWGIGWGLCAILAQATGAILSRTALIQSSISPLWSSLLRLLAGIVLVLLLILVKGQEEARLKRTIFQVDWSIPLCLGLGFAAFAGTYLGIWLQQTSLKFAPAGIAQTLLATSPLFILPIAFMSGERISKRAIGGTLLSFMGIILLFR